MVDNLYEPTNVAPEWRPLFDQLQIEFAAEKYEIWVRVEDWGRNVSAGIVNRPKLIAVVVPLRKGIRYIPSTLDSSEIERIRNHLISDATEDLLIDR